MFEYLDGKIIELIYNENKIILDINGIGYSISVSKTTIYKLENYILKQYKIYISETSSMYPGNNTLYGFLSKEERDFFLEIKNVNKIGAKGALDILSRIGEKIIKFKSFIINQDEQSLNKIFGFTQKKAENLILGLKNKIKNLNINLDSEKLENLNIENKKNDAIEALKILGYNQTKSKNIINEILKENNNISLEELIKVSLKKM